MIPGSANPLLLKSAAAAGGYQVERSLRFNSSDSAYLSRSVSSAGNRKTFTLSWWMKKSGLTTFQSLFNSFTNSGNRFAVNFDSSIGAGGAGDYLTMFNGDAGSFNNIFQTNALFRDASAWYHITIAIDTTQASSSERVKLWVNGTLQTFSSYTAPSQNADLNWNSATGHYFGVYGGSPSTTAYGFNGYLAEVHHIDGQALTPSSFTEVSATTGQLIPKAYTGSFGTNGFWLKFSDNSNNTAATLGKDYSGNSNNWTPNNLSVTAGAGNDSLVDTPTSYGTDTGVGNEVRGNYCTLSPLIATSGPISNGNLEMVGASAWRNTKGTISVSTGKWYFEATYSGSQYGSALGNLVAGVGFAKSNTSTPNVDVNDSSLYGSILAFSQTGHVNNFNAPTSARSQIANGDVIGFALNYDAGTYTIYVNNTSTSSGSLNFTGELTPWTNAYLSSSYFILNFGQRPFAYTAPSGFKALCDTNLPSPLVAKGSTVMDVKLYTGNGSTQTISGLGFSPDLVWLKVRSAAVGHGLFDQVRGAGKALYSHATNAEYDYGTTSSGELYQFNSDGFNLGSFGVWNVSSQTSVAWCWDAGSSTVTNTQGSITSSLRASPSSGFSVVTYTTTGSAATIGHGLNVAPSLIITKQRNGTTAWYTYHTSIGAGNYLLLNSTAASAAGSSIWNNTAPTSTVFSVGNGFGNGETYVAYCFSPVVGYSSFGSYTGNGNADGPFVYTGFRPRWVMVKVSSASGYDWLLFDSARDTYNATQLNLRPDLSDAESSQSANPIDFLSNGFKLRGDSSGSVNPNQTLIYAAFAESPFQYSRAR